MSFGEPLWLAGGAVAVALLALLLRASDRRRTRDLARFAAARVLADLVASLSPSRRFVKRTLLAAGVALAFVALAEPLLGVRWEETRRRGIDVMIALDVSRSMLARDVTPNRLTRAKLAITDLAGELEGDRLGLIAFAGSAFLQCPLTLDHAAFLETLDALEPGIVPTPGTDVASALSVAMEAFRSEKHNVKLLVLFSDGEDLGGGAIEAASAAAAEGVKVFTVGIGSPAGELIPIAGERGGTAFVKDEAGHYVKSHLDEDTLRKVAEATGGFYEPLGQRGEGVQAIVQRALEPIPKEELASRMRRVPIDRYQWPLAVALVLLAAELLVGERRRVRTWRLRPPGRLRRRRGAASDAPLAAGLVALLLWATWASSAAGASASGAQSLYDSGNFSGALDEYREAAKSAGQDPRYDFNVGASAYKAGKFDDSAAAFARALSAPSPELQEKSFYNLGNAQFRVGQGTLKESPERTTQAWQQALDAYDQALRLRGDDADARYNRDLVKAALEQLRQQQQQEQQNGSKDDKQQSKDQKQQGQKDQSDQQNQQDRQQNPQSGDQSPQPNGGDQQPSQQANANDSGSGQPKSGDDDRKQGGGQSPADGQKQDQESPGGDRSQANAGSKPRGDSRTDGEPDQKQDRTGQAPGGGEPPSPQKAETGEPKSGPVSAANQQPAQDQGSASAAPPGQLSASDAQKLLDSLRGDERRVPIVAGQSGQAKPAGGQRVRDW